MFLMIKLLLKPSMLGASDPCTIIWIGNDQQQLRISMRTSPNSGSQSACTFASLSNKEKHPSMMKPQDQPATMTISAVTPSKYTTLTPMVVGLWKTGKRILAHPHKKEVKGPSTKDQTNTTSEGAR
jgi:hypothetical protein